MTIPVTNLNASFQQPTFSLRCKGKLLDLTVPVIMGILNVTPDSFHDGGKFTEESIMKAHVEQMLSMGAKIIDIGAASSKPGAEEINVNEELKRLIPAIQFISQEFPNAILSVDTFRSEVAKQAIINGVHIINDISGGDFDDMMFETVAALKVPYILMHMQGNPQTMQKEPIYGNVVIDVFKSLQKRIIKLRKAGVIDIIIDPGFGFGKSVVQNFQLLNNLEHFLQLDCPIMVGFSRKSMINKVLEIKAIDALNGTTILNTIALQKGVSILRVHDVKEAIEAIRLVQALKL